MEKLGNTTADLLHIYLSQVKKSVTVYIISGTGDTICHNNNNNNNNNNNCPFSSGHFSKIFNIFFLIICILYKQLY